MKGVPVEHINRRLGLVKGVPVAHMNRRVALWAQVNFPRHPLSTMRPDPGGGESLPLAAPGRGIELAQIGCGDTRRHCTAAASAGSSAAQAMVWPRAAWSGECSSPSQDLLAHHVPCRAQHHSPHGVVCKVTTDGSRHIYSRHRFFVDLRLNPRSGVPWTGGK